MYRQGWNKTLLNETELVPHGTDIACDMERLLPWYKVKTFFDVGVYEGEMIEYCLKNFPDAEIVAFEPVSYLYNKLFKKYASNSKVNLSSCALSDSCRSEQILILRKKSMCHLRSLNPSPIIRRYEWVDVVTLDKYCKDNGINHIDFLKVDTEGGDLRVLQGASSMLDLNSVGVIQVEASMNKDNLFHVQFDKFECFLQEKGYKLFGVYNQVNEWPEHKPNLRRVDLVYISEKNVRRKSGK